MQNVNAKLLSNNDAALAKAQAEHKLTKAAIDLADSKNLALKYAYPHGYCADVSVELATAGEGRTLKELVFEMFKPLPLVHVFAAGSSSTIKPLAYVRESEQKNSNVVPVFPVYTKSTKTEETLRWWTKTADGLVAEVALNSNAFAREELTALYEGWGTMLPDSHTYSSGHTTFMHIGYKPAASAVDLPLLAIIDEIKKVDSFILNSAWGWRLNGVEATQKNLDAFVENPYTVKTSLPEDVKAEAHRVMSVIARRYIPLALETDALLAKCAAALEDLFKTKGVPECSPFAMHHLRMWLAEEVGVKVESLVIRRHAKGDKAALHVELGTKGRAWFAPHECTITVDANRPTLRLQDIPVTYEVEYLG